MYVKHNNPEILVHVKLIFKNNSKFFPHARKNKIKLFKQKLNISLHLAIKNECQMCCPCKPLMLSLYKGMLKSSSQNLTK